LERFWKLEREDFESEGQLESMHLDKILSAKYQREIAKGFGRLSVQM
jgi:hypothetical protein